MTKYGNLGIILIMDDLQNVSDRLDLTTTSLWFRLGNAVLVTVAESGQEVCTLWQSTSFHHPFAVITDPGVNSIAPLLVLAGPSLKSYHSSLSFCIYFCASFLSIGCLLFCTYFPQCHIQ